MLTIYKKCEDVNLKKLLFRKLALLKNAAYFRAIFIFLFKTAPSSLNSNEFRNDRHACVE